MISSTMKSTREICNVYTPNSTTQLSTISIFDSISNEFSTSSSIHISEYSIICTFSKSLRKLSRYSSLTFVKYLNEL